MKGTERFLQDRANEKFAGRGGANLICGMESSGRGTNRKFHDKQTMIGQ